MRESFSWGLQPHPRSFNYVFRAQLLEAGGVRHVIAVIPPGQAVGLKRDRTRARVLADSLDKYERPPRLEEVC